jgi:hypothetical protein
LVVFARGNITGCSPADADAARVLADVRNWPVQRYRHAERSPEIDKGVLRTRTSGAALRCSPAGESLCLTKPIEHPHCPQSFSPASTFPFISNLSLNLGLIVEPPGVSSDVEPSGGKAGARFARIKLPPSVPRLVPIDESRHRFTLDSTASAASTLRAGSPVGSLFNDARGNGPVSHLVA